MRCLLLLFLAVLAYSQQLVLPGDHPDPTVIRVGNGYWASNTSAEWLPVFPLFHSSDLIHWQPAGAVFQSPPAWASGNFWAPELVSDNGKFRVYYAARKRGGPLCVAVADADHPAGPYRDHGPLVCQSDGSIDPFFVRDEHGAPYLIWKEDGNSVQQPTWIWAQPLTNDGLALQGQPTHLIRNDAPWEGAVVEGADILSRGGWFYLFYAGGACCGLKCDYAVGVARSRHLLGPWTKDPHNPIETSDQNWTCPGHGTITETSGGAYEFLHHAYSREGSVYIGREAVLDEIAWDADGWPSIKPSGVVDNWQWPLSESPRWRQSGQSVDLQPDAEHASDPLGAILAKSATSLSFTASVSIHSATGLAGIAVIGDPDNAIGIGLREGQLMQFRRMKGNFEVLSSVPVPPGAAIEVRVSAAGATEFTTEYRLDDQLWANLGAPLGGTFLPPWDRGLRIGLVCGGAPGAKAEFRSFNQTTH